MRRLDTAAADFSRQLDELLKWDAATDEGVHNTVREIIRSVREQGDEALLEYTRRFDQLEIASASELEIDQARLRQALQNIDPAIREALTAAADRVRTYHEKQKLSSWRYTEEDGTVLGQQVTAMDRVGVYVPGGKAAYPSSVLMNVIPAHVAGVAEIIMVVPTPRGEVEEADAVEPG